MISYLPIKDKMRDIPGILITEKNKKKKWRNLFVCCVLWRKWDEHGLTESYSWVYVIYLFLEKYHEKENVFVAGRFVRCCLHSPRAFWSDVGSMLRVFWGVFHGLPLPSVCGVPCWHWSNRRRNGHWEWISSGGRSMSCCGSTQCNTRRPSCVPGCLG